MLQRAGMVKFRIFVLWKLKIMFIYYYRVRIYLLT